MVAQGPDGDQEGDGVPAHVGGAGEGRHGEGLQRQLNKLGQRGRGGSKDACFSLITGELQGHAFPGAFRFPWHSSFSQKGPPVVPAEI